MIVWTEGIENSLNPLKSLRRGQNGGFRRQNPIHTLRKPSRHRGGGSARSGLRHPGRRRMRRNFGS